MGLADLPARIRGRLDRQFLEPRRRRARARENANRSFTPIFVSGAMGSGTTLLGLELFLHFETAGVLDESCLLAPPADILSIEPIASHPDIAAFQSTLEPSPGWSTDRARDESQVLYRAHCEAVDLPPVDKAANAHLFRTAFVASCFPDASFLVIVRDPVANIEGFRRKWPVFGQDDLAANIRFYRAMHERFLAERDVWGERALVLGYEALVAEPEATRDVITRRLGFERRGVPRTVESRGNTRGQGIRNVGEGGVGIVRDANARAIESVAPGDADEIRGELGDLHAQLLALAENVS